MGLVVLKAFQVTSRNPFTSNPLMQLCPNMKFGLQMRPFIRSMTVLRASDGKQKMCQKMAKDIISKQEQLMRTIDCLNVDESEEGSSLGISEQQMDQIQYWGVSSPKEVRLYSRRIDYSSFVRLKLLFTVISYTEEINYNQRQGSNQFSGAQINENWELNQARSKWIDYNLLSIMIILVRWAALIFLAFLAIAKEDTEASEETPHKIYRQKSEEIKLLQKNRRNAVGIEKTSYKNYNFIVNKSSEFILRAQQSGQIRAAFDAYWNQNNVYLQAAVVAGEEIYLTIEDLEGSAIVTRQTFYSAAGLNFKALAGRDYRIAFKENGTYTKLMMMQLSETVISTQKTAKRDEMAKVHSKLLVAKLKLENSLKSAAAELIMQNQINKQILRQSENYASFEIMQAVFIIIAAVLEVKLVTKLLKSDIIV